MTDQLFHVEVVWTTSLEYRSLAKCKSKEFKITIEWLSTWLTAKWQYIQYLRMNYSFKVWLKIGQRQHGLISLNSFQTRGNFVFHPKNLNTHCCCVKWTQTNSAQFDPNTLPPEKVNGEIEIGSFVLFAYGNILRNFINLKVSIGFPLNYLQCNCWNVETNTIHHLFRKKIYLVKIMSSRV